MNSENRDECPKMGLATWISTVFSTWRICSRANPWENLSSIGPASMIGEDENHISIH